MMRANRVTKVAPKTALWDQPTRLRHVAFCLYSIASCILLVIAFHYAINWKGFSIRDVKVAGEIQYIPRQEVDDVIQRTVRGNFFTVSVATVRDELAKLPWVRRVIVRRRWPATLEVYFEEHRPVARWLKGGLINTNGEIFRGHYQGMQELPLWFAPPGSERELIRRQAVFLESLTPLGLEVKGLELSARHAWTLVLNHGVKVFLGRDNVEERLHRFAWVHRSVLQSHFDQLDYVDLRYNSGFVVKQR